ncbi:paraquat-inducible protein A [Pedobacter sp. MC2016-15]|uniref:paraquat-inducible protein A n=1 Tax=Pedobacter sp. MC2016-15 TaxID=2994473 RepID=UPI002247BE67|nr:paraquat-inducible protein A [Pedobacter sp. MC2016-15]MCX2480189.1 paraquat-inducible protein A [Pedobacter sp. MC2016-15]
MTTQQTNTTTGKFGLSKILLILGLSVLLCGEAWLGYHLDILANEQTQIKEDYSMSNNITFGLFSLDQWRERIGAVVDRQVTNYKITPAQKKAMQKQVEQQLSGMISSIVKEVNKPQESVGGKLKKFAFNQFVDPKDLYEQVPSFSRTIVNKVTSPRSVNRLKDIASSKIDQLEDETYDSTSVAYNQVTKSLYGKYKVSNAADFDKEITTHLADIHKVTYNYAYAMLACVVLVMILWWLLRNKRELQNTLFIMSLCFAFILLAVGMTAPIIDVDARIQTLDFMMMGKKVTFENQVLFFQSKSIMGIVHTLIEQPKPDAVLVGILIMLFVIILPLLRMIAKGIVILGNEKLSQNKVVKYLTFELGKWDMADVMVVGIAMTYIGLNGILKSQLSNLNIDNEFLKTTTVNYTSLQPGFIIFVGYVAFEMVLTYRLNRIKANDPVVH